MTNRVVRHPERGEKNSPSPSDAPQMVGDRMAGSHRTGIRETAAGPDGVRSRRTISSSRLQRAARGGVRASVGAAKRVTTVEPRDAGKWMRNGTER